MAETQRKRKAHSDASALPEFVEPMKTKLVESLPSGDWIYEIKFDGYRALALRGGSDTRVLSRNEKDLGRNFKEVRDSVSALDVRDAIIDGEIVALDEKGRSSFQLLQAFEMGQEKPAVVFCAFDLLQLNGQDLRNLPVEERKAKLEGLLKKPPGVVRYSESGGYTEPEGARKYFGALLVGVHEGRRLKFAGRVGAGFSEKLLRTLYSEVNKIQIEECPFFNLPAPGRSRWDRGLTGAEMKRCRWVKPAIVCRLKFAEWTRDDRLRQPVFLGMREDKNPKKVVREKAT